MKNTLSIFLLLLAVLLHADAQKAPSSVLTADSLASGNYKDVLTSFFKFAIGDLAGPDKRLDLAMNLFALKLKTNPSLDIDTNYVKHPFSRNTNFNLGFGLGDNHKFNGGSLGMKYALINCRDYTVSEKFISLAQARYYDLYRLHDILVQKRSTLSGDVRTQFQNEADRLFNDSTFTFDKLSPSIKQIIIQAATDSNLTRFLQVVAQNPKISLKNNAQALYEELKKSFQNKALLTISLNAKSYNDYLQLAAFNLNSEFLKGFINPDAVTNLEAVIKANLDIVDDTLQAGRDLDRSVFSAEMGLNWVVKSWDKDKPFIEFKLTGSESFVLSGLYKGEGKQLFTLNGILRIRVSNDISIPLEIKYDPNNGNVFGFLNITTNFTALGK